MKKLSAAHWKAGALDLLVVALGSLLFAVSVTVFSSPNDIAPGGVTGLAILARYLWGLPIGTVSMVINLPLLLIGWRHLGRRFVVRTVAGVIFTSLFTDLLAAFIPAYHGEQLLVCLFGGALSGLGLGLIFSRGYTTGGTDVVARLLERRFPHIPIGRLMLLVDGLVIALSVVVFRQVDSALYAAVYAFVSATVTDKVVYGGRRGKVALIFTSQEQVITGQIINTIDRSVTLLDAVGGYTGRPQKMLLCAVSRDEVFPLKRLVFAADPNAFFMMLTSDEVFGFGWQDPDGK